MKTQGGGNIYCLGEKKKSQQEKETKIPEASIPNFMQTYVFLSHRNENNRVLLCFESLFHPPHRRAITPI